MRSSCPICGSELSSQRLDYAYTESGLPNVTLLDLEIFSCTGCGEEMAAIPCIEDLHRVLAFAIATQACRLSGAEIRFLRKYLGWSGKDFARTMGVDPATVSRWENEKDRIGLVSDRLLRAMVLRLKPIDEYPTERLSELGAEEGPPPTFGFALQRGSWRSLAKAA